MRSLNRILEPAKNRSCFIAKHFISTGELRFSVKTKVSAGITDTATHFYLAAPNFAFVQNFFCQNSSLYFQVKFAQSNNFPLFSCSESFKQLIYYTESNGHQDLLSLSTMAILKVTSVSFLFH